MNPIDPDTEREALAQDIRFVDGNHALGAGVLAGALYALGWRNRQTENGSCWDEGPTPPVREGECAPMPPRCELRAGNLGAHRGGRAEWMTRPAARPVITEEAVIERLASEVDDDCGWLSDAQNARPEWDAGNRSVRFCGEGSIDVGHMVSIVLEAVFGESHEPTDRGSGDA